MKKTKIKTIFLIILGSSLILFDVSFYSSYVEMLGFTMLVLGFGLLSIDNRNYVVLSCVMCVGLFLVSIAVDYAVAQRAPQDGILVSFGEYLSNSLDYVTVTALVLSLAIPFIVNRARGSWEKDLRRKKAP